jgi:hypothetical protein
MSHRYRKTTYIEEGAYGSEDVKTIYMHQNNSCDVVTIYDEDFNVIISYGDTTRRTLMQGIREMLTDKPEENKLIEFWIKEDRDKKDGNR